MLCRSYDLIPGTVSRKDFRPANVVTCACEAAQHLTQLPDLGCTAAERFSFWNVDQSNKDDISLSCDGASSTQGRSLLAAVNNRDKHPVKKFGFLWS